MNSISQLEVPPEPDDGFLAQASRESYGDAVFKIVLLGDEKVGKTALLRSFVGKGFSRESGASIGDTFLSGSVLVNGENVDDTSRVKLQVWD